MAYNNKEINELESAAREVHKYALIAVNQIICLEGDEICQPCLNREKLSIALKNLEKILNQLDKIKKLTENTENWEDLDYENDIQTIPPGNYFIWDDCTIGLKCKQCGDEITLDSQNGSEKCSCGRKWRLISHVQVMK